LMEVLGGRGSRAVSLREMAVLVGLPAKPPASGRSVADLWLDGRYDEVVAYNEGDAVTTYLLWLRTAHFAGRFTAEAYARQRALGRGGQGAPGGVTPRAGLVLRQVGDVGRSSRTRFGISDRQRRSTAPTPTALLRGRALADRPPRPRPRAPGAS